MSKSEELKRLEADLKGNEELKKKLSDCYIQLGGKADAAMDDELMAKAAAALGYKVTEADFARSRAEAEELSPEELEKVSGGDITIWCPYNVYCFWLLK